MRSKISSDWLPSYIKAMQLVLKIFRMTGYFPYRPHNSYFCLFGILWCGMLHPLKNHFLCLKSVQYPSYSKLVRINHDLWLLCLPSTFIDKLWSCWWEYRRTSWQSSFVMVFWEDCHGGAFTSHYLIGLWLEWQYKLYFECQILMLHKDQVCNKPTYTHIGRNWKL